MRDANLFETTDVMAGGHEPLADSVAQIIAANTDTVEAVEDYVPFADMPVLDRLRTCD